MYYNGKQGVIISHGKLYHPRKYKPCILIITRLQFLRNLQLYYDLNQNEMSPYSVYTLHFLSFTSNLSIDAIIEFCL